MSNNNLERRTFKDCNLIEGLWSEVKYISKHIYNHIPGDVSIEDFLFESLWRRDLKFYKKENLYESLKHWFT